MSNRPSTWNLLLNLAAYVLFMTVLLGVLGSGVGEVELMIWLVVLVVGALLIIRRYRNARNGSAQADRA